MKTIRLVKRPSFYEDLDFSHWLMQDRLLAVILDRRNHVVEVHLDARRYREISAALKAKRYIRD